PEQAARATATHTPTRVASARRSRSGSIFSPWLYRPSSRAPSRTVPARRAREKAGWAILRCVDAGAEVAHGAGPHDDRPWGPAAAAPAGAHRRRLALGLWVAAVLILVVGACGADEEPAAGVPLAGPGEVYVPGPIDGH